MTPKSPTLYLCLYLPFAHDAVTALPGDRVRVSFKALAQRHRPR